MKDIPHVRRVVAVMLTALSMAAHGSDGSQGSGAGAKEEAHASGQTQAGSGSSPASPIEIVDSQREETPDGDLEREFLPSGYARVVRVDPSDLGMSDEDVDVSRIRILEGQDLVEDLVAQGGEIRFITPAHEDRAVMPTLRCDYRNHRISSRPHP